jgi:outer membrane receptor protein involved in Fe transport
MIAPRFRLALCWSVLGALALACFATAAMAQTTPAATPPAKAAAKPKTPNPARRTTTKTATGKGATTAPTAAARSAAPKDGAPRRLTDVHIEGEMPVPQVLFITARDQRRYVDFQHQRYLRDSRALGAATATPTRVTAAGDDTHH